MNDDVLRLDGITKTYLAGTPGQIDVLRGLDLRVGRGEVVALVAPSGAGKSTLLHIAGLLDTPDQGTVTLNGADLTGQRDMVRTMARRRVPETPRRHPSAPNRRGGRTAARLSSAID